jgi:hypothetical protein
MMIKATDFKDLSKPEPETSSSSSSLSPEHSGEGEIDRRVFWGKAHQGEGKGEFIEVEARALSGDIFLRGIGRGKLLSGEDGVWERMPTRQGERVLSWHICSDAACEVSCITREALYIVDCERKVLRFTAPNVNFSSLQVYFNCIFAISDKGHVLSWGRKYTGHVGPDTRPGMEEHANWEPFVGCKRPMEVVSAMRVVPSDDFIVQGCKENVIENVIAFMTKLGGRVLSTGRAEGSQHVKAYKYNPPTTRSATLPKPPAPFIPTVLSVEDVTLEKPPVVAGGLPYVTPPPAANKKRTRESLDQEKVSTEEEIATAAALQAYVLADENDDVFKFLRKHEAISRTGKSKLVNGEPLVLLDEDIPLSTAKVVRLVQLGILEDD